VLFVATWHILGHLVEKLCSLSVILFDQNILKSFCKTKLIYYTSIVGYRHHDIIKYHQMTLIHYSHDPDDFHDFPQPFHFLFKRKRENGRSRFAPPCGGWLFDRVAQPSRAVGTVGELSSG